MIKIGLDLGGTKIEIIALDQAGRELVRERADTPRGDYHAILDAVVKLVENVEADLGTRCTVGIGTPGALSKKTGCLKNSNTVVMNGKPVLEDLRLRLRREVRIANDADCFTLSEAIDGAASGADTVFGVILGTGVGGGVVVKGWLLSGPNAIAGEWGHNPLPWADEEDLPLPRCYCGKAGCIETFLSGPGFTAAHRSKSDTVLSAAEIVRASLRGDPGCALSMHQYEHRLARSLAMVINLIDPDVIVLGGGLSNCESLYENVPRVWRDFVFSDRVDTRLVRPKFGDSSGVRGAAWLWGNVAPNIEHHKSA
ncbi:MAG: ROK family protein [Methylococcales bacterium]